MASYLFQKAAKPSVLLCGDFHLLLETVVLQADTRRRLPQRRSDPLLLPLRVPPQLNYLPMDVNTDRSFVF